MVDDNFTLLIVGEDDKMLPPIECSCFCINRTADERWILSYKSAEVECNRDGCSYGETFEAPICPLSPHSKIHISNSSFRGMLIRNGDMRILASGKRCMYAWRSRKITIVGEDNGYDIHDMGYVHGSDLANLYEWRNQGGEESTQ